MTEQITTGTRFEISVVHKQKIIKSYNSIVEEMLDGETVLIYAPIEQESYVKLHSYELYFVKFDLNEKYLVYECYIQRPVYLGNLMLYEIKLIGNGEVIQQRDYFRMPFYAPLSFYPSEMDESGNPIIRDIYEAIMRDISGGGLKMASKFSVNENNSVHLTFDIDDNNMRVLGEIRRKVINLTSNIPYVYGHRQAGSR